MLSRKLIEYIESTNEAKQALDPNIRKQYNFQIREKVEEAISHFNLILSSHSDDQLKKIFSDDRIIELFEIIEKSLDVADWRAIRPSVKRRQALEILFKNLMLHCLDPTELTAYEELMKKYNSYATILHEISKLDSEIANCLRKSNSRMEFIKSKGLEKEFEAYQLELITIPFENFLKLLKNKYTDEQIEEFIKIFESD